VKGSGKPYHRRFTVLAGDGVIEAQMQDHVHHMRIVVTHADGRVVSATAEGIRLPWDTCPLGVAAVSRIAGMTVSEARDGIGWPGGRSANCVHIVDLTRVALGHLDEPAPFTYTISVSPGLGRVRTARIERDGRLLLEWTLDGVRIRDPAALAGHTLAPVDFTGWRATLDPELHEPATLLRRACHIAPSRDMDLDGVRVAADRIRADSSCYTLQPGVIETAHRIVGTFRPELTDADQL
jgi:hypothetical protein